jgi:uncharacterized protein (DUF58 family)
VTIWVDAARSMAFSGDKDRVPKLDRARLLALALSVLLLRGGERVGLSGTTPKPGRAQIMNVLAGMSSDNPDDYGTPEVAGMVSHGRAVFLSDFLGNLDPLETALTLASDRGVRGVLLQVLDPAEEDFPYQGRTVFESMQGSLRHETQSAGDLRSRYLDRLAERKARLTTLARAMGWHYHCHHTGQSAQTALLWAYSALEGGR